MIDALLPYKLSSSRFQPEVHIPRSTFSDFQHLISGPVTACILLDLCRGLPLDPGEITEARITGWQKEAIKIEEPERPCTVNWDPIFDNSKFDEPMLPFLAPNPTMNKYIFAGLHLWKRKLQNSVLLPRTTRKNMSRATRREFEAETGISLENTPIFSQEDWQRFYHETGIPLGGATEMRQKWYPSGAKPRTYFAQGGHHYQWASYLQDAFTSLVNCVPFTHHITRLVPTRLRLFSGSHYRIYDLSTFTSNMAEQRGFVKRLAEYCWGTPVYVFDARVGVVERDLGDLMTSYYQECCYHPEVSYERVPGVVRDAEESFVSDHGVASMLGIFGNLMTCTFAHGALLAQCVEKEDLLNVAGDDGIVEETDRNRSELDWTIRTIGDYEMSKTFSSSDEGAICLKRPIWEELGGLQLGIACIPPTLVTAAHYLCNVDDPRYTFHDTSQREAKDFSIVGKDLLRFLRSVHRVAHKLDDVQLSYACLVAEEYSRVFLGEPHSRGRLPHSGDSFLWPAVPTLEDFRSDMDPLDILIVNRYNGCACLPILCEEREDAELSSDLEAGDVLRCNSTWELHFAEILGYVQRRNLSKMVHGLEGWHYLKRIFLSHEPHLYEYTVLKPISPILF